MLGFEVSGIRQNSFARENAREFSRNLRYPIIKGEQLNILIQDGKVTVDGANVVTTDIACSNGVIHAFDSVILPASKEIVDTEVFAGSCKMLAAALTAAGLFDILIRGRPILRSAAVFGRISW